MATEIQTTPEIIPNMRTQKMPSQVTMPPSPPQKQYLKPKLFKKRVVDQSAKIDLVETIVKYGKSKRFSRFLQENEIVFDRKFLNTQSLPDLRNCITKIRYLLANRQGSALISKAVIMGLQVLEQSVTEFYDVSGLTMSLQGNEEFLDAVEQLKLEYNFGVNDPKMRLCLTIAQTALIQNQINKISSRINECSPKNSERSGGRFVERKQDSPEA